MSFPTFQITKGLYKVCPGARFKKVFCNNTEEEYSSIQWKDIRPFPTWQIIEQASLTCLRYDIKQNINQRTSDIIVHEFKSTLFPNQEFHMTLEWQFQVQNIWLCRTTIIEHPYDVYCSSNEDGICSYVTIASHEQMNQFYLEGFVHVDNTLKKGRSLKDSLANMSRTSLEEFRDVR
jgi:hypothetical protein